MAALWQLGRTANTLSTFSLIMATSYIDFSFLHKHADETMPSAAIGQERVKAPFQEIFGFLLYTHTQAHTKKGDTSTIYFFIQAKR